MDVCISKRNSKMGDICSVSLPSGETCIQCGCNNKCYARRIERLRPNVLRSYQRNYKILQNEPEEYWREVEAAIMLSRFFRFHVSGDIPDDTYFKNMVDVARRNMHCEILCFTKKYEIVNNAIRSGISIPKNLHVLMSAWVGLDMDNPYKLPEAHVIYRDGTTTARSDAVMCEGNCAICAASDSGCWVLVPGQQVVFHEH